MHWIVGKPLEKHQLGKLKMKWEDITKLELRELG
jgi:hypothetical protein